MIHHGVEEALWINSCRECSAKRELIFARVENFEKLVVEEERVLLLLRFGEFFVVVVSFVVAVVVAVRTADCGRAFCAATHGPTWKVSL